MKNSKPTMGTKSRVRQQLKNSAINLRSFVGFSLIT